MASTTDILALAREIVQIAQDGLETTIAWDERDPDGYEKAWAACKERTAELVASRLQQGDAEMRADAERYRWLRDEDASVPDGMRELCVVQFRLPFSDEPDTELFGRYLDAAIDAARQSSAGGEGQP